MGGFWKEAGAWLSGGAPPADVSRDIVPERYETPTSEFGEMINPNAPNEQEGKGFFSKAWDTVKTKAEDLVQGSDDVELSADDATNEKLLKDIADEKERKRKEKVVADKAAVDAAAAVKAAEDQAAADLKAQNIAKATLAAQSLEAIEAQNRNVGGGRSEYSTISDLTESEMTKEKPVKKGFIASLFGSTPQTLEEASKEGDWIKPIEDPVEEVKPVKIIDNLEKKVPTTPDALNDALFTRKKIDLPISDIVQVNKEQEFKKSTDLTPSEFTINIDPNNVWDKKEPDKRLRVLDKKVFTNAKEKKLIDSTLGYSGDEESDIIPKESERNKQSEADYLNVTDIFGNVKPSTLNTPVLTTPAIKSPKIQPTPKLSNAAMPSDIIGNGAEDARRLKVAEDNVKRSEKQAQEKAAKAIKAAEEAQLKADTAKVAAEEAAKVNQSNVTTPEEKKAAEVKAAETKVEAEKSKVAVDNTEAEKKAAEKKVELDRRKAEEAARQQLANKNTTTIIDPLTKKRTDTLMSNLKQNIFGAPVTDLDYAYRGGFTHGSKEEINADIEAARSNNISLKSDLDNAITKLNDAIVERDFAMEQYNAATDKKEKAQLLDDYNFKERYVLKLTKEKEAIERKIATNNSNIITGRAHLAAYERIVQAEKDKVSAKSKIGKKLENLGKGAETVTSGLYDPKSGFGAGKDWFGPKGFLKAPYKEEAMKRNPVNAPTLYKLGNITQATGSTAARIGLGEMQAVHGSKLIAPMGVGGTVAGSRNRFDLSINPKRITLKDVAGFNRPRAPVQQYTQVTQADGSVINVPVPAPAHYRKPKAPVSMVSRLVKSSVTKPLSHNSALERGVKSVGTFRPMEFTNATMIQFKQVSKPVKVNPQQRQSKPFTISLNRFTNGSNIITTSPIKKNMFASGIESVGSIKGVKVIPQARTNFDLGLIKTINIGEKKEPKVIDVTKAYRTSKNNSAYVNMNSILNVGKNMKKLMKKTKVVK